MGAPVIQRITAVRVYFIPVKTRVPLKFGPETLTSVTCARVMLEVLDANGRRAEGWGETPLSVQWVWPSQLPYQQRHEALTSFCLELGSSWLRLKASGHALEWGVVFQRDFLQAVLEVFNASRAAEDRMPWLAALVCCSAFDLALHDAYGKLAGLPVYQTYGREFFESDLAAYLEPASDKSTSFQNLFPADFLLREAPSTLPAWHLVGGLDALDASELLGDEPNDGYPVTLQDWIRRDGLKCLKVKLRGTDPRWDFQRVVKVGQLALASGVEWLSADFNCTVESSAYVNDILDQLQIDQPRVFGLLLYVEQPFPYELESYRIDVSSVASRKPLFLDESAHDWRLVRLGRELGWTGVALKTCKTQTGAILSGCWAKAHGMQLMVQDLTNPMLAQIPHVLLAAHVGTIMGVETNAMQFYPAASTPESKIHPGLYQRRNGNIVMSSIQGSGFGYRLQEIERTLPEPALDLRAD